eukprot:m.199538 g.199538  ORF g.199538 m.199538 type:complete len:192 (-) comp21902_c2_seq4:171-746(-)
MWAAGKGAEECLRLMAQQRFDVLAYDQSGGTALHAAAFAGNVNCVSILLQHGAVLDVLDSVHQSALFRACEVGHAEVAVRLTEAGASVNLADSEGRTPLHWLAAEESDLCFCSAECPFLFCKKGCPGGHDYISLALLHKGAQVESLDKQGRTPLQCAAFGGHVDCMSLMLQQGAAIDYQDREVMQKMCFCV